MLHKVIQLTDSARLYTYVSDISMTPTRRDALLVIPGGGYSFVAMNREGEPVALEFCGRGMNCFVLEYSVGEGAKFPQPLREAALAMKHIRENAESYHVDPDRIFAMGFSAGGHLTASLGSFWNRQELTGVEPALVKPRGTVLIYPVINGTQYPHPGSFHNLCGTKEPTREALEAVSVDLHVGAHTVPAFLMHTAEDALVPVENSLIFSMALSANRIPFECHIMPRGIHGMALSNFITCRKPGDAVPEFAQWPALAYDWMKRN